MTLDGTDVAVVIPTQNRWDVLERTLAGLRAQSVTGFEIVVVVDEGAELPEFSDEVRVVYRNRRGVGAARNDGVKATTRPLIVFLGDDTIPEPGFMERHLAMHRRHPEIEVGVLGAVHWHPEVARGRFQQWLDWSGTQFEYHTIDSDEAGWGRLYTSNVSLKRELYLKVGGFDEEFLFGYEDIELGLRLHNAGLRLLYEPGARVAHVHRYEWPAIERRFRLVGGGEYLMVRKHPDFPPFFLRKFRRQRRSSPLSAWPRLVDYVPSRARGLRRAAEVRADAWYSKRLAPPFVAGWLAAEELEEERMPVERYDELASERLVELRWLGEILKLVRPGAEMLSAGCSTTVARELAAAGYRLTFAADDDNTIAQIKRRLDRRGVDARVGQIADVDKASTFDVALAFHVDRAPDHRAHLDAAERQSALVAASFNRGAANAAREVLDRAGQQGTVLRLDDDDTTLVIYRGQRPLPPATQTRGRQAREAAARYAAQRFGRRRPWLPFPQVAPASATADRQSSREPNAGQDQARTT